MNVTYIAGVNSGSATHPREVLRALEKNLNGKRNVSVERTSETAIQIRTESGGKWFSPRRTETHSVVGVVIECPVGPDGQTAPHYFLRYSGPEDNIAALVHTQARQTSRYDNMRAYGGNKTLRELKIDLDQFDQAA